MDGKKIEGELVTLFRSNPEEDARSKDTISVRVGKELTEMTLQRVRMKRKFKANPSGEL